MSRRWAVYWAPEAAHPLWRAGCDWLGRDPTQAADGAAPAGRREPWQYGFHATLKAPMVLREGATEAGFVSALRNLAERTEAFEMPALEVTWLSDFLALRPTSPLIESHPLRRLADACVAELDPWRAGPMGDLLERRRGDPTLDAEQRELFDRWGYAHVFSRWRFHMTLSDSLATTELERRRHLQREATAHFAAALAEPLHARSLCLFVEERPGAGTPLRLVQRLPLAP